MGANVRAGNIFAGYLMLWSSNCNAYGVTAI